MSEICPICNGLFEENITCPSCGLQMENMGRLEDLKGPYSPYMDKDSFTLNNELHTGDDMCIHLYCCPQCEEWEHSGSQLMSI